MIAFLVYLTGHTIWFIKIKDNTQDLVLEKAKLGGNWRHRVRAHENTDLAQGRGHPAAGLVDPS